ATEEYMRGVMYQPKVKPFWFQIPFRLTNSLSFRDNFLYAWDPKSRDVWLREQDPVSIKRNPLPYDRFKPLISHLGCHCDGMDKRHAALLVGMRAEKNIARRFTLAHGKAGYKGVTWCRKPIGNTHCFYPLYDWTA